MSATHTVHGGLCLCQCLCVCMCLSSGRGASTGLREAWVNSLPTSSVKCQTTRQNSCSHGDSDTPLVFALCFQKKKNARAVSSSAALPTGT